MARRVGTRRRTVFHAGGPRIAAAAAALAADYDVQPLTGEPVNALVLVGVGSAAQPTGATRLIGLVEPGDGRALRAMLEMLLASPERARELGRRARARCIERYSFASARAVRFPLIDRLVAR